MEHGNPIAEEAKRLFDHFVCRLLELGPRSVLDVGTGSGRLLRILRERDIPCLGVDPLLPDATEPGMVKGDAAHLPFGDTSFDWLVLRHVPHHLPKLEEALAACGRVAKKGVLLSEPWFDGSEEEQRVAERWDLWEKRQHERAGMLHKPVLSAGALRRALPLGDFDIETEHYRHHRLIPLDVIEARAKPLLELLPQGHADRAEWEAIRRDIQKWGLSYNGTLIMTLRKKL